MSMSLAAAFFFSSQPTKQNAAISKRKPLPAPIVMEPSQRWEGNNGPWSTFGIQVGPGLYAVDISIGGQETWVVGPEGCPSVDLNGEDCRNLRGGIFDPDASKTWQPTTEIWNNTGIYQLEDIVLGNLRINGTGIYGFDTINLSIDGGTTKSLNHTIVAVINTTTFYMGKFGVSPRPTNFTVENGNSSALSDPQPSFFSLLKKNGRIPSLSYAFTAGSYSRKSLKRPFGSFIFGGYDASLVGPLDRPGAISFDMGPDIGRELIVGIQAITKHTKHTNGKESLLQEPIFAALESSQSDIWLPRSACKMFEKAFGLEWNDTAQMYLVNDSLHETLVDEDAIVSFRLGDGYSGTKTIDIDIPYSAFDLKASYPLIEVNSSAAKTYFPLKRAADDSQYTLGRTFFQEAYFVADYERNNFSLSQRLWNSSATTPNIVPIRSVDDEVDDTKDAEMPQKTSTSLSTGAIVGIVIGAVAFLVITVVAFLRLRRRYSSRKWASISTGNMPEFIKDDVAVHSGAELDGHQNMKNEMDNSNQIKSELPGDREHRNEMDGTSKPVELLRNAPDVQVHELVGDEPNLELAVDESNVEIEQPERL